MVTNKLVLFILFILIFNFYRNHNIVRNEMIAQVKHSIPDEQLFFDLNEDNSDVEENKVPNNVVEVVEEAKQGSNEDNVIIIRNDPVVDVGSVLDDDVKVDQVDLVDEVEEAPIAEAEVVEETTPVAEASAEETAAPDTSEESETEEK